MSHYFWHKDQPVKPWLLDPSGKYGAVYNQDTQRVTGHSMSDRQHGLYQQDMADWEEMKNLQDQRQAMFQKMAQTTGDVPAAYKSRMGQKEARPFFADTRPISEGSVDILAPEVETLADLYRKRKNMFRMV